MQKFLSAAALFTTLLFTGCACTDEDCVTDKGPFFKISFAGFTPNELVRDSILILHAGTGQTFKKIKSSQFNNTVTLQRWSFSSGDDEMRDFVLVLFTTATRRDTISDIAYEDIQVKIDCGTCFPFGRGSTTTDGYRNLSFKVNGVLHTNPAFTILK